MKPLFETLEIARRFNEDEAVWRRFEEKRRLRNSMSFIPESILDEIDWREAEQEVRVIRCIGKPLTSDI